MFHFELKQEANMTCCRFGSLARLASLGGQKLPTNQKKKEAPASPLASWLVMALVGGATAFTVVSPGVLGVAKEIPTTQVAGVSHGHGKSGTGNRELKGLGGREATVTFLRYLHKTWERLK